MKKILLFTFIILLLNSCSLKLKNLPIPEGNFKIGTDTFIFEDKSRLEWFTEDNENDYRRIAVQMWILIQKFLILSILILIMI